MENLLFRPDAAFDSARSAQFQRGAPGYADIQAQQALRVARSRRLDRLGSRAMFPCGLVITSVGLLGAFLTPALAVVTDGEFVVIPAEPAADVDVEYGRVARAAVTGAEVFDGDHQQVPEDVLHSEEELRPDVAGSFVLMVEVASGQPMTLVFLSAIEARRSRDRFREWRLAPSAQL
ncbi:MAG: hypothetical protein QOI81_513 [Actinomycetota bacterium]|jgi:hypothetical protein|nr:hypothetical protein [Actinomycetota bacterium]